MELNYNERGNQKLFPVHKLDGERSLTMLEKCCHYLDNAKFEIGGISIYGIPWIFGDNLTEIYNSIPEGTDILITHAPPYGYGDIMTGTVHSGNIELTKSVMKIHPKFHVFGHAHEAYGVFTNGETIFVNGSTCTTSLKPTNPVIVFDIPKKE